MTISNGDLSLTFEPADPYNGAARFVKKRNRNLSHVADPAYMWRWGLMVDGNELSQTGRQPQGTRYDRPGTAIITDVDVNQGTDWYETSTTFDHSNITSLTQRTTLVSPTEIEWRQTVTVGVSLLDPIYAIRAEAAEIFRGTRVPRFAMEAPCIFVPPWMCDEAYGFDVASSERLYPETPPERLYDVTDETRLAIIRTRARGDHAVGIFPRSMASSHEFDRFIRWRDGTSAEDGQSWCELTALWALCDGVLATAGTHTAITTVAVGTTAEVEETLANAIA